MTLNHLYCLAVPKGVIDFPPRCRRPLGHEGNTHWTVPTDMKSPREEWTDDD